MYVECVAIKMSISGALIFPTNVSPDGRPASFGAPGRSEEVQLVGNERFATPVEEQPETSSENAEREQQQTLSLAPQPIVDPANLSQAQESAEQPDTTDASEAQPQAGVTELPPRGFADPTRLREVQNGGEEEDGEIRLGVRDDEDPTDIAARLVPVDGVENADSVALDGRPDSVRVGDLISEDQRLTGEPLAVPNFAVDPEEQSIEIFNERLSRTVEVLQFLNQRPNAGAARGVSIIV